jgi:hypothetical protein
MKKYITTYTKNYSGIKGDDVIKGTRFVYANNLKDAKKVAQMLKFSEGCNDCKTTVKIAK